MKIAVLIKQVPDTWQDRQLTPAGHVDRAASEPIIDEITERALELALRQKDADKSVEVVAVTMGPAEASTALRKALQLGADAARHLVDDGFAGSDALATARVLAAGLADGSAGGSADSSADGGFDLVIAGDESTDGRGGVVPAMVAELLNRPFLGPLNETRFSGGTVDGTRQGPDGLQEMSAELPAVITVTERSPEARFPKFKGIMAAKRRPVTVSDAAALGLSGEHHDRGNVVLASTKAPARSAGPKIADDGTAAGRLVDYLIAEDLI